MREPNEVLHDEDVAGVAGLRDDRELLVDAFAQVRRDGAVLRDRARLGEGAELLLRRLSGRYLEVREAQLAQWQAQIDLLGDAQRVLERLVVVREELAHLRGRPHEELGVVDHLQAVRRVDGLSALDAHHHVLRLGVLGVHVVDVVRDDERQPRPARDLAHALVHALLLGNAVRHELEVVIAVPEDASVLLGDRACRVNALILYCARQLALQAGRKRDQPLAVLPEEVLVHPRAVVVALKMRGGDHRDQVLIAGEILRMQYEVPGLAVALRSRIAIETVVAGDVGLDTDDRLDASVAAERVEVDRAIERAVIGEAERRHVQRLRARDEVAEAGQPIEQAVLAMGVQMDEVLGDDLPHVCAARGSAAALMKSSRAEFPEEPHLGSRCSFEKSWTRGSNVRSKTSRRAIHRYLASTDRRFGRHLDGPLGLRFQLRRSAVRARRGLGTFLHVRPALRPHPASFDAGSGLRQRADLRSPRPVGGPRLAHQGRADFMTFTTTAR